MNPYQSPSDLSSAPDVPASIRPAMVIWAVGIFSFNLAIGLPRMFYPQIRAGHIPIMDICLAVGMAFLFLRGIYRGRRWAHVVFLIGIAIGLFLFVRDWPPHGPRWPADGVEWLQLGQRILAMVATVILLLPESWRWFYRKS